MRKAISRPVPPWLEPPGAFPELVVTTRQGFCRDKSCSLVIHGPAERVAYVGEAICVTQRDSPGALMTCVT